MGWAILSLSTSALGLVFSLCFEISCLLPGQCKPSYQLVAVKAGLPEDIPIMFSGSEEHSGATGMARLLAFGLSGLALDPERRFNPN